jgi:hypothetical protein
MPRYLTKSRFKLATQCPTKLFYTGKDEYPDRNKDNDFLQQLAEGGYQVGKLAEYKFPGGTSINELDYETALNRTNELLQGENCTIYEAAFRYGNLFVRADVVVKNGNNLYLYEVKAKSYGTADDNFISGDVIMKKWREYLYDVAFQKYVIKNAFPNFMLKAHLTLINKEHHCTVEGLHQQFRINREVFTIIRENGEIEERIKREIIVKDGLQLNDLDTEILINKDVDEIADAIISGNYLIEYNNPELDGKSFEGAVNYLAEKYNNDEKINPCVRSRCGKCEFKAKEEEIINGKKHGQFECFKSAWEVNDENLKQPTIFELWKGNMGNNAGTKTNQWLNNQKYFLNQLDREDFAPRNDAAVQGYMSNTDRREVQVDHIKQNKQDSTKFINGLREEFENLEYPLHFIDFETIGTAIPFNTGRKPYEAIAFQFSHHTMDEYGLVTHANEWLNFEQGAFPNFDFVRALKNAVGEKGSIFRYAAHENTILNKIEEQLIASKEQDKNELIDFIHSITIKKENNRVVREAGKRNMIDLLEWVKKYYYHPLMKGSNSIKAVLPAILNDSDFLNEKYSQANYNGKNFKNKQWYVEENGIAKDPYKLLIDNSIFQSEVEEDPEENFGDVKVNSGGPAMMAYAEMQFMETTRERREKLKQALLRYCELDTLAMVMIFEHWKSLVERN